MPFRFDISGIVGSFLAIQDEDQLGEALRRSAHDLGFERFAMGHHVDLVTPPDGAMRVTNYDPGWIELSLGSGYFADDPVHRASNRTATGFLWSDIRKLIRLTARQYEILLAAREYGLSEGYTVPVHVPGEYRGTCSFGARSLDNVRPGALPIANIVGTYAFEAARRIIRMRGRVPDCAGVVPVLTERQRDALVLVARGKADPEIGILLGISQATAHEHVENIRRAYGNAQRPNLIARALFDGQISYTEALGSRIPRAGSG